MKYLNLGCGYKYVQSEEWVNADMIPVGNGVIECNFLNGIPLPSDTFDAVYHSHVLEHFAKADGEKFIAECYRILKPGGILRIALPNLEMIAKEYLKNIERAEAGEANADKDYDWMMLEMYDQTVRNQSGGNMISYLTQPTIPNESYVFSRIGGDGKKWRQNLLDPGSRGLVKESRFKKAIRRPSLVVQAMKRKLFKLFLSKKDYQYYTAGQFRFGGEIHQWMYDRYSLGRLLGITGFKNIEVRTAVTSYIPNWADYKLDDTTETASLFIEAIK
jgi:predicted SAM-dependent methyltransferase